MLFHLHAKVFSACTPPSQTSILFNCSANMDCFLCVCTKKNIEKDNYVNTYKNHVFITSPTFATCLVLKSQFFLFSKKKRQREAKLMAINSSQP